MVSYGNNLYTTSQILTVGFVYNGRILTFSKYSSDPNYAYEISIKLTNVTASSFVINIAEFSKGSALTNTFKLDLLGR